jgi:enoyl-CoA hydratase/carnithine racemase
MKLILTGERMTAQRAKELGIVQEVHPTEKLHDAQMALAEKIAAHSLYTLSTAKVSTKFSFENSADIARQFERSSFFPQFNLPGAKEGITAFVNKRKPNFEGK